MLATPLEALIVKGLKEASAPLVFNDTSGNASALNSNPITSAITSGTVTANAYGVWTTANGVKSLSRTSAFAGISAFVMCRTVAASYQYEYIQYPGQPTSYRNWKFTACDQGTITHTNPGAYQL